MANRDRRNQPHENNRERFREYDDNKRHKKDKPWKKGANKHKRNFIDNDERENQ